MACIVKRRGRWVIDFYDNQGRRRWKTMPKGSTKKNARDKMREIEDRLLRGVWLPDRKVPIFEKIAQDWLEYKKPNLRASTWRMYKGHVARHYEDIKDIKINRITTAKVEKFITDRLDNDANITTLRKLIVTFNQIMNYAVRHKYIDYNPVRDAERPKGQGKVEDKAIRVLTPGEINALFESTKDLKFRTMFKLAIMSGARQGELFGLQWTDIDWDNSQIKIRRTFNNGAWYKPKSKTSYRRIDIGPIMLADLRKWRLACPRNEHDLVFPNTQGQPMNHSNLFRKHFWPALKAAKLPKIRFHDLRHTFASLLIEQGENIKYIQNQIGHSSSMLTLEVYAHLMKPANQAAACRLENTVFSVTGSKTVAENRKGATA